VLSRKIEYLMALAKEGHFARAAAMCHVSQPTLSAAIQDLEAELGVAIVRRGQRFQGLTPEGELVLRAATRMAAERDQLHQQLGQESRDGAGSLRIGALQSTIPLLRSFTVPFRKRFPDVNLNVRAQSPADVQDAMEARALDVAITYLDQSIKRRCRTRTLYLERYELLIRKGTALSGRAKASWEDLRELPLCLLSPESPIFGAWESELLRDTLAKTPHIVTNARGNGLPFCLGPSGP
jgi:DNA-binding transcriptional LysR family regulator